MAERLRRFFRLNFRLHTIIAPSVVGRGMPAPLKSLVGLILNLVAVVYCFGLDYYFIHSSGSVQDAENNGLGPTVFGLGIVGLLFSIALLVQLALVFIELRKPKWGGNGGGSSGGSPHDGERNFDADAVVARYLAQRQAQADSGSPAAPGLRGGTVSRPSFGKNKR